MTDADQLFVHISDIYDAALDPTLWTGVLNATTRFVGGSAGSIFARDSVHRTGNVYYSVGVSPAFEQLYLEKYIKLDPFNAAYLLCGVGEAVSNSLPDGEFVETRFYKEWVQPQGWVDNVYTALDKTTTGVAGFVVLCNEADGFADGGKLRRMRLLAPHLRRALLIAKLIDLRTAEAAVFADTFDGIHGGMFLVDAGGRIVHTNATGQTLIEQADFLRAKDGRLVVNDAETTLALRDIFVSAGKGDAAIGVKGITVPLEAENGDRHVAHVLPLTSGARRQAGAAYTAAAAVFVHRASLETPSPPEAIARSYKLTSTELRVLLAIVEVGGAPEVATALGVAESTIKTHLGRLFQKTGTGRQADLVKLVAGFSTPLLS